MTLLDQNCETITLPPVPATPGGPERHRLARDLYQARYRLAQEVELEILTHPHGAFETRHTLVEQIKEAVVAMARELSISATAAGPDAEVAGVFGIREAGQAPHANSTFLKLSIMRTAGGWQYGVHQVNRLGQSGSGFYCTQVEDLASSMALCFVDHFKPLPKHIRESSFGRKIIEQQKNSTVCVVIL